jgi:hypothetical protein
VTADTRFGLAVWSILTTLVEHAGQCRDGAIIFADLIGKLDAPYKSGPSKTWLKIKNPNAPAATRAADGTF